MWGVGRGSGSLFLLATGADAHTELRFVRLAAFVPGHGTAWKRCGGLQRAVLFQG